jgi:hypothetical protein
MPSARQARPPAPGPRRGATVGRDHRAPETGAAPRAAVTDAPAKAGSTNPGKLNTAIGVPTAGLG